MKIIELKNFSFTYNGATEYALRSIDFSVEKGEFVVLRGLSGSGKSTLLRMLKPSLTPAGECEGDLTLFGKKSLSMREETEKIAFVTQDTEAQTVCDKVWHEIAFTLENLGMKNEDMRRRVDEVCEKFGIGRLKNRAVGTLSGGERQLVNLASASAAGAELVVLDEPLAQLSPAASEKFLQTLVSLNKSGVTVVLSEHRDITLGRALYIDGGRIVPNPLEKPSREKRSPSRGEAALSVSNLSFSYNKNAPLLDRVSVTAEAGCVTALTGENGSGKTTLLSCLIKQSPHKNISLLPQQVDCLFACDTVRQELAEVSADYAAVASVCRLDGLLDRHPYDLSGGEKMRVGIAKILLGNPDVIMLDEPTRGLDERFKEYLAQTLRFLAADGKTVLVVTHDDGFVSLCADRVLELSGGKIFEKAADLYAPSPEGFSSLPREKRTAPELRPNETKRRRDLWAALAAAVLLPLTAFGGVYLLNDRGYLAVSLIMIFEIFLLFIRSFEKARRSARYLTLLAVLAALAAVSRIIFAPAAQIKPIAAVVIISGMCLGVQGGFMCGMLSVFLSNIYLGQGPWTPWQMLALGLLGGLAGLVLRQKGEKRLAVTIFSFFGVLLVYGGIVNLGTLLMSVPYPTLGSAAAVYLQGLPFDLVFAASTAAFMWIFIKPFAKRIRRIKQKYRI